MKAFCHWFCVFGLSALVSQGLVVQQFETEADLSISNDSVYRLAQSETAVVAAAEKLTAPSQPKLYLLPPSSYLNTTYVIGKSLPVTARFNAGKGNVIDRKSNGIEYYLRRVNKNWEVLSDVLVTDKSVIGQRRGISKVEIPLVSLIPSPELPSDEFYLLYAQFTSSNGLKTEMDGIAPLFIVDENASTSQSRRRTITTPLQLDDGEVEDSDIALLRIQNPEEYINNIFAQDEAMFVSAKYNAGKGNVVDDSRGGVSFFLRRVDADWNVLADIIVYDRRAIGSQSGVSQVYIPLNNLVPSENLPEGQFYFLYVEFVTSGGAVYNVPGISPITIIGQSQFVEKTLHNKSSNTGPGEEEFVKKNEVVIASGTLSSEAFLYETRSKGRRCEDIKRYDSPKLLSRSVIELVLICQALRSVDKDISIRFIAAPSYGRALDLVRSGRAHIMGETVWDVDLNEDDLFVSEPIIKKGDYYKGVYTTEKNLKRMKVRNVSDLRRYTALTPVGWEVDIRALRGMGIFNKQDIQISQAIVKILHSGRADYVLSDFTKQKGMAITDGGKSLYPIPGIKVRLDAGRRFVLSNKTDFHKEIYNKLNQGLKNLREGLVIEKAFIQSGFTNPETEDWKVLND